MEQAPTMFTGILLSIRRRGPATSFILRNVVQRTGVEMQIFPCSPLVKDIRVEKLPPKRFQLRAKLFYLREAPEKMSALASGKLKDR
jgi:large subunit ribosomal protein L19